MAWLDSVKGKVVVIKLGGNAIVDSNVLSSFAEDVADLTNQGVRVVVVHGGGPQITASLAEAGIETKFVDGLRFTSLPAAEVIRETLFDKISKPLAELIEKQGVAAKPLNGVTEDLLLAEVTRFDLGRVGEVFAVRDGYLFGLLEQQVVPVISSIAPDEDGLLVNVNADLAAASIAIALSAEELLVLTDVAGLYTNWPNEDSLVHEIQLEELEKLAPKLESGMIPKVEACLNALNTTVKIARIVNGSLEHTIRRLSQDDKNYGTKVTR